MATLLIGCSTESADRTDQSNPGKERSHGPNLVVVMTDDQSLSQFNRRVMPFTWRFFHERGAVFTEAVAVPPLCCPARAGFLTGQYPHNHGVFTNRPGYPQLHAKGNTLPAWLNRAGYRTGFIGKYLNGYEAVGDSAPAPGWERWFAILGFADYFAFQVSEDGEVRQYGEGDYATDVLTREASRFIRKSGDDPFFLWLSYNAPHTLPGGYPPPCDGLSAQPRSRVAYRRFAPEELPQPPSFNERDVADKPRWVRRKEPLSSGELDEITRRWRCGLAALSAVDRGVQRVVATLRGRGELDDTLIVFHSDNGYFYGEHRIGDDKRLPYEPALRVPLAIKPPRGAQDGSPSAEPRSLVSNIDLAPTLLDYARARACIRPGRCRMLDGRSLRPLLEGADQRWPADRGFLLELDDGFRYEALRTPHYLYVELRADRIGPIGKTAIELYDLDRDPNQLRNLWRTDRAEHRELRKRLALRLDSLRGCAGLEVGSFERNGPACE